MVPRIFGKFIRTLPHWIKIFFMSIFIKLLLSALLLLCLAPMPYGYYQLVRFAALLGFALLAYQAFEDGRHKEMIIYGALALLFKPFIKVALGRQIWNVVDVIVGLGLLASLFWQRKGESSKAN